MYEYIEYHTSINRIGLNNRLTERGLNNLNPFYVWYVGPVSLGTMGGLRINNEAQVLRQSDSEPIPGLFAAGEVANGDFYYKLNPAQGSSLGIALTFGRIAGRNAATTGPH